MNDDALNVTGKLAGLSYPEEPRKALKWFDRILTADTPPDEPFTLENPLIVPHIDFRVNQGLYGEAWSRFLKLDQFPECIVILGVGHQCPSELSSIPCTFDTILGKVETDFDAYDVLDKGTEPPIGRFPDAYHREHSLEYVVIWLQALHRLYFKNDSFKVVPVLMGGLQEYIDAGEIPDEDTDVRMLGVSLKKLSEQHPSLAIVASIDGCHVGPRFGHPSGIPELQPQVVQQWEGKLWEKCRSDSFHEFFAHLSAIRNIFYFDGVGVLSLLLQNYNLAAKITGQELWYEDHDDSFVTFSSGQMNRI